MMGVASILSLSAITSLFVLRYCKAIFLHDGCLIQEQYNIDTFEDSLTFLMLFPPEDDFFLSVSQDSPTSYFYPARGRYRGPKAWMQVELHLGDSIELRFENGTAWMKELRTRNRLFPRASVSMSLGFLAADCPQKTPFWTLREKAASLTRELWNHQNITYSLYSTAESWVYLAIGREVLLLCWDNATAQLLVGPADLRENHCVDSGQFLPALQMLWLQVTFEEGLVTLSSPENNGQILRSLYKNTDSVTLNFKTKRTRGEVYVVEHISGYPRPADALPPSYRKVSSFRSSAALTQDARRIRTGEQSGAGC
ncbi:uncharacterized protein LOC122265291 [Penaeus japonicus]|uniref:uncharacterized protein LOC122265291 n=1 Tax=Penaeus japonicus TaxID=27405 RepID=UPI001C70E878|nr:uncharacterized protein LOC122265291 [Penaeus japonicus]